MKKMIILLSSLIFLVLLSGCTTTTDNAGNDSNVVDNGDNSTNVADGSFTRMVYQTALLDGVMVEFEKKVDYATDDGEDRVGVVRLYFKKGINRVDLVSDSGERWLYHYPTESVIPHEFFGGLIANGYSSDCGVENGQPSCSHEPSYIAQGIVWGFSSIDPIVGRVAGTIIEDGSIQVAGLTGTCFKLVQDKAVERQCFTDNGTPIFLSRLNEEGDGAIDVQLKAVKVESVSEESFVPPVSNN